MVRKVEVKFGTKPPLDQLIKTGVVHQLSWEDTTLRCFVVGPPGPFIKALQDCEVFGLYQSRS